MFARPLQKARSVNATTSAYPSRVDTLTEPVGDSGDATGACVIEVGTKGNGSVPRFLELWPYAAGGNNDTFSLRVVAWQRILPAVADGRFQWCPSEICEVACTISADTGVAGGQVLDTERYADTITIVGEETTTAATTNRGSVQIISPTGDLRGHLRVDIEGVEKIELIFDQTLNTPSMNALYRFYDRYDD